MAIFGIPYFFATYGTRTGKHAMEHRLSRRIPLEQQAMIECPRMGRRRVRIENIGLSGMVVESTLYLPLYAPLTVSFSLGHDRERQDFQLDAMVVRHTPAGAALMFSDLEACELRRLNTALYPTAPPKAHRYRLSEPGADRPAISVGR
jgi:hypothetical protein